MAKGKAVWWVLEEKETNVHISHYRGPDKARAREVAAKKLKENPKVVLGVVRVSRVIALSVDSLKQSLPKDAF